MKRVGWTLLALAVVAVVAAAIGVRLIDTPAARAEIQTRLSAALGGRIEWQSLELRILPRPHGELHAVRIEIPGAVSARADDLDVYLRLWPLLRGRAEIASVSLSAPQLRIQAAPGEQTNGEIDPVAAYRAALAPVAEALRKFAPDTLLMIKGAALDIASSPVRLHNLNITARSAAESLELDVDTASNYWQHLRFEARIAYEDLSAVGSLKIAELTLHKDLPPATLRAQLRTDGKTAIECDVEAALGALLPEAKGKLLLPAAGKAAELDARLARIDLPQAIALARRHVSGLETIESLDGSLSANVRVSLATQWRAHVDVIASDASLKLAQLPWKLSLEAMRIAASEKDLRVTGLRGALGESSFSEVAAQLDLGKPLRLSAASGRATLNLAQWLPWLRQRAPLDEVTRISGEVDVTLNRMALRFDRPAAVDFDALAVPRQVSVALKSLPAAAAISGGSVRADASQVRLDKVPLALLDAKAVVSGTLAMKGPRIELALADGMLGEKLVQWVLARGDLPARFEPRTPLRFAAKRIAWAQGAPLEADALIDFQGGPSLAAVLAWQPGKLNLRRLAIKDTRSDAVLSAVIGDDLLQTSFAGTLYGQSMAAMLRQPQGDSGVARGNLRLRLDRKQPQRSVAEGKLRVDALDLSWLAGGKAMLKSIDFSAQGSTLRIAEARLEWQDQPVNLSGEIRSTDQGPVIDARLESTGVIVERLLPAQKPAAAVAQPKAESKLWPLPVTGRVAVRAGFVQYQHHKIAPLEGNLVLERQRARLEVKEARMCGISFPLAGEVAPDGLAVSAQVTMQGQPMDQAMLCLTGSAVEMTGNADVRADLSTRGKAEDLIRNLTGSAQAELRNGRVKKFALIGNILSLRDIASLRGMKEEGFAYRSLSAKGRFERGEFLLEEGFFDSDAARLAASGRIDLLGANSQLNVLVGLLTTVDRVAGAVPLIGDVFGGSLTALPVAVSGDIRDPRVVPLGVRAVSDRLLGIFERTLKLPGKLVVPTSSEAVPAAR
jgi:uncharacterized protein involved in outer membrane biogenesis